MTKRYDEESQVTLPLLDTDISLVSRAPYGVGAPFGKHTLLQLKEYIDAAIGADRFLGNWNSLTNSPTLTSGVGTPGDMYFINVAGNTSLDGILNWAVGDFVVFDGPNSKWRKVSNQPLVVVYNSASVETLSIAAENQGSGSGNIDISTMDDITILGQLTLTLSSDNIYYTGKNNFSFTNVAVSTATSAVTNSNIRVTATPVTITLSDSDKTTGKTFFIKDVAGTAGTSPITITPQSGTIDGQSSLQIVVNYGSLGVDTNGTNWFSR